MSINTLTEAPSEQRFTILNFNADSEVIKKFNSIGIHVDDDYIKFQESKWGPILIKNLSMGSSMIAIGRKLADKIEVGIKS